jgi:hypothetical protein
MSKPSHSFPRPLSELLSATLSDVLKAQGFASTEIISRWRDIVGPEIAGHSEPLKINWPRAPANDKPEPATLVLRVEAGGARNPAPVGGHSRSGQSFLGWQAIGRIAIRQAPLRRREPSPLPVTDDAAAAQIADALLTSRTTICARRSAGWVRQSSEIEPPRPLGRRARHCHNYAVQLASRLILDRRLA